MIITAELVLTGKTFPLVMQLDEVLPAVIEGHTSSSDQNEA